MNIAFENNTPGKILYADEYRLYKTLHNVLFISDDRGRSWEKIFKLGSKSFVESIIYNSHLLSRLFRKGIHHFNLDKQGRNAILFDKQVAVLEDGKLANCHVIKGSRPLSLDEIGGEFVFGEYRSNPERSPIGIYGVNSTNRLYKKAEITGVRHIHGIYEDSYTDKVWVTTGDNDEEAAIYATDVSFTNMDKVLEGSQQTRAIKLLFDENYIYFGSDAPHEVNYLYRMNRFSRQIEKLVEVGSSVFHGCKVGNWMFFSTAVEPSKVNETKFSEIWASPDGTTWKCIFKVKKDLWSMRYFQYGQIFFPSGPGNRQDLWFSLFATRSSNRSFRVKLRDLDHIFADV